MLNHRQRMILEEAAKHGGANISVPEQMARAINEETAKRSEWHSGVSSFLYEITANRKKVKAWVVGSDTVRIAESYSMVWDPRGMRLGLAYRLSYSLKDTTSGATIKVEQQENTPRKGLGTLTYTVKGLDPDAVAYLKAWGLGASPQSFVNATAMESVEVTEQLANYRAFHARTGQQITVQASSTQEAEAKAVEALKAANKKSVYVRYLGPVKEEVEIEEAKVKYITGPGKKDSKRIIGIYTMSGKWVKDMNSEKEAAAFVNKSWGESVEVDESVSMPRDQRIARVKQNQDKIDRIKAYIAAKGLPLELQDTVGKRLPWLATDNQRLGTEEWLKRGPSAWVNQEGLYVGREIDRIINVLKHHGITIPHLESADQGGEMVSEYYRRGGFRSSSYSGDPRWITAKYAGVDAHGKPFKKGEEVLYFPNGKKFYTGAEAEKAWREFLSAKGDEMGMPYAS